MDRLVMQWSKAGEAFSVVPIGSRKLNVLLVPFVKFDNAQIWAQISEDSESFAALRKA